MLPEPLGSTLNIMYDVAEASVVIGICDGTMRHDSNTARRSTVATSEYRAQRSPRDPMDNFREVAPFCAIRTASQHGCCPRSSKSIMLGSSAGIEEHHTVWMGSKPTRWVIDRPQNLVAASSSSQSWGITLASATNAFHQAPSIDGSAAMQTSQELGQSLRLSMEGRMKTICHRGGHATKKEWANMPHGCDFPFLQLDEDGSALMQTGQSLGHPMDHIDSKLATHGHPHPSIWGREQLHQSRFWPVLACFSRDLTPLQYTRASRLGSIYLGTSVTIIKRHRGPKCAIRGAYSHIYMHFQGQIRPELGILAPSNGQKHGENTSQTPILARSYPHEKVWDPSSSCHAMQGRWDSIATHVTMKSCAIADAKMRATTGQGKSPEGVGANRRQWGATRPLPTTHTQARAMGAMGKWRESAATTLLLTASTPSSPCLGQQGYNAYAKAFVHRLLPCLGSSTSPAIPLWGPGSILSSLLSMGKLQSPSAFEATASGVVLPRSGTRFFGKRGRNHVPSPRIEGDTSYPLSTLNGSTSRARVKVHGAATHNMEHSAPEVAAPESTHPNELATWAPPTGEVGLGTSRGRPKATPEKSGEPRTSPRGEIGCESIDTTHNGKSGVQQQQEERPRGW